MLDVSLRSSPPPVLESLLEGDAHVTLFLRPRWMSAITAAYPVYRPGWFVAERGGAVCGVLPFLERRRLGTLQVLSLPFGTHGGPVLAPGEGADTARALADAFLERASRLRVMRFEMTVFDPPEAIRQGVGEVLGDVVEDRGTHILDLTAGHDRLWNDVYHKNTRNCVRMAQRAGVTVTAERSAEAAALLARLHASQSAAWEGYRPHPEAALRAVVDTLGEDARVYVARRDGRPLVACLVLDDPRGEAHDWVIGSAPEARPVRAVHLLHDVAIREACERGVRRWNFGASGGNPGIVFFKESFGAKRFPVWRYYRAAGWARRLRGDRA